MENSNTNENLNKESSTQINENVEDTSEISNTGENPASLVEEPKNEELLKKEEQLINRLVETTQLKSGSKDAADDLPLFQNEEERIKSEDYAKDILKKYKKYVIRVNKEYVDFLEQMPPKKRNKFFNDYLQYELETQGKKKQIKLIQKVLKHLLIIIITVMLGFPAFFYLANLLMNSTLESYKYMQVNFEKLYQQQKKLNEF